MPETLTTSSARRGIPIFQLHNSKSLLKYEVQQHHWGSVTQFVLKFLNMCLLLWCLQGTFRPLFLFIFYVHAACSFFLAAHAIWFSKEKPFETFLILCSDISHIISYYPPHDAGNWLTGYRSRGTDFTPEYYSFCNSPLGKIFRPQMTLHNMKKKTSLWFYHWDVISDNSARGREKIQQKDWVTKRNSYKDVDNYHGLMKDKLDYGYCRTFWSLILYVKKISFVWHEMDD